MINRMLLALASVIGAVALTLGLTAGTASAYQEPTTPEGFIVTVGDCGLVTVEADSIPYNVSSGVRTAGLAIRINGETVAYTEPDSEHDNGSGFEFTGSLTAGPFTEDTEVEFRWFAGPDRNDLPAWDLTGDWVDIVVEREAEEGRHWDARDDAPFIGWYSIEVEGCPVQQTPSPDPTATPDPTPSAEPTETPSATETPDPVAGELPVTSGVRLLPALLIGGFLLVGLGAGLYYVTRRRVDPTP